MIHATHHHVEQMQNALKDNVAVCPSSKATHI